MSLGVWAYPAAQGFEHQLSLLIEILQALGATVRWAETSSARRITLRLASKGWRCHGFHMERRDAPDHSWCTEQMLTVPGADGCDQVVDDGGDANLLITRALSCRQRWPRMGPLP